MSQILFILHKSTSDPGLVGKLLQKRGFDLNLCFPAEGETLPTNLESYKAVVIFGGPMSANDEHLSFIRAEIDFISRVLEAEKPFLGICLGAQLLARTLGATVAPHPEGEVEVGYFPIQPTVPGQDLFGQPMYVYHWHREGWQLPKDAVLLARGEAFPNQAFHYSPTAYGFQFHPEITAGIIRKWTTNPSSIITEKGAQSREEQLEKHLLYQPMMESWLEDFFSGWLK